MFLLVSVIVRCGSGRGRPSSSHASPTIITNNQPNCLFVAYCCEIIPFYCVVRCHLVATAMFLLVSVIVRCGSGRGRPSSSHVSTPIITNNQPNCLFVAYYCEIIPFCCVLRCHLVAAAMFSLVSVVVRCGSGRGRPLSSHVSTTIITNNQPNCLFVAYCCEIIPFCCVLRCHLVAAAMFSLVSVVVRCGSGRGRPSSSHVSTPTINLTVYLLPIVAK